jgi:hypothetical protein
LAMPGLDPQFRDNSMASMLLGFQPVRLRVSAVQI